MENKDLAQKIQAILSETPKMIHKCIEDGEQARAFRILSDYANQRVIETLEEITNKGGGFLVVNDDHFNETVCNRVFEKLEELKQ